MSGFGFVCLSEKDYEVVVKEAREQGTVNRCNYIMMQLGLNDDQKSKFHTWNTSQNDIIKAKNNGKLNIGAAGGQVQFRITPTGIGTVIEAKNTLTKNKIDLTEY